MWLKLGGWGISPHVLDNLSGGKSDYFDIHGLMKELVVDNNLCPDWPAIAARRIGARVGNRAFNLMGWSTGAMIGWAIHRHLTPRYMVLIAPTQSFCRRDGHPHGWKPAVLKAMRRQLRGDRDACLGRFRDECGIGSTAADNEWELPDVESLTAGLHFLEQVSLIPPGPRAAHGIILHGQEDRIIPCEAGRAFGAATGMVVHELPGAGHAFFMDPKGIGGAFDTLIPENPQ